MPCVADAASAGHPGGRRGGGRSQTRGGRRREAGPARGGVHCATQDGRSGQARAGGARHQAGHQENEAGKMKTICIYLLFSIIKLIFVLNFHSFFSWLILFYVLTMKFFRPEYLLVNRYYGAASSWSVSLKKCKSLLRHWHILDILVVSYWSLLTKQMSSFRIRLLFLCQLKQKFARHKQIVLLLVLQWVFTVQGKKLICRNSWTLANIWF